MCCDYRVWGRQRPASWLRYSSHTASPPRHPLLAPEDGNLKVSPRWRSGRSVEIGSGGGDQAKEHVCPDRRRRQEDSPHPHPPAPVLSTTRRTRLARPRRPALLCQASRRPMAKRPPRSPAARPMGAQHANEQVRWRPARQGGGGRGLPEARRAAAEPAESSAIPPWPPLRPPPPASPPPRSSGAWRPAPAGSAAGPASTTSPASCGSTREASSCCGRARAKT